MSHERRPTIRKQMRELVRLIEEPRVCSYLPSETAALEYRIVQDLDAWEYESLLERGYRRFGRQLFRPGCPQCAQCVSVRVLLRDFKLSANQRRVLRANRGIDVQRVPVAGGLEHLALYNRYHQFMARERGWRPDTIGPADYADSFLSGGDDFAWQWEFRQNGRLVGLALMDETPNAVSLVYAFHDPDWRPASPGTFAILHQLLDAQKRGKRHAYPGYWIEANRSMAYKARFRPFERLHGLPERGEQPDWVLHEPVVRAAPPTLVAV